MIRHEGGLFLKSTILPYLEQSPTPTPFLIFILRPLVFKGHPLFPTRIATQSLGIMRGKQQKITLPATLRNHTLFHHTSKYHTPKHTINKYQTHNHTLTKYLTLTLHLLSKLQEILHRS